MIGFNTRLGHVEKRAMFRLAWPALTENLLITMTQFVDTAMVGGLGAAATAAVAVNATPMWLFNGLVAAVGVGGTALVARMIGSDDRKGVEAACRQVFIFILVFATALFALVMLLSGSIPRWMRADAALHGDATTYLRIVALAFIPHFTGVALGSALRGAGDTQTPMRIAAVANVLHVVGNFFFIYTPRTVTLLGVSFHVWGAGMGIRGAALSTAISTALAGCAMVWAISRPKSRLRLTLKKLRPDFELIRRILHVGIPTAMERVTINVGQLFFVGMISSLGTAQLAAHHLSITVESLSYMPGFAFSIAATTLVGQSLGALNPDRAKAQGLLAIRTGTIVMTGIGVAMFLLAPYLIAVLTPDETVRSIGTVLIRICAIEQPFTAISLIGNGALRGAGDTRVPFLVSLAGMWGVRLALAWFLAFPMALGVNGAWIAMVTDLAVRSLLTWLRFARGKWMLARV